MRLILNHFKGHETPKHIFFLRCEQICTGCWKHCITLQEVSFWKEINITLISKYYQWIWWIPRCTV